MVQRGGGLGFALESCQGLRILGHVVRQKFQRHEAVEAGVFCLEDHTHAAAAELFDDAIMGYRLAREWLGIRHRHVILWWGRNQVNEHNSQCVTYSYARSRFADRRRESTLMSQRPQLHKKRQCFIGNCHTPTINNNKARCSACRPVVH
jgi:hypothetical protein